MSQSSVSPNQCTTFIQIWVDVKAFTETGSISGIYIVDNCVGSGSTGEGTDQLNTHTGQQSSVCWQVLPIDPTYNGMLSIQSISGTFTKFNQQPGYYDTAMDIWTCTVGTSSTYPCTIELYFEPGLGVIYPTKSRSVNTTLTIA